MTKSRFNLDLISSQRHIVHETILKTVYAETISRLVYFAEHEKLFRFLATPSMDASFLTIPSIGITEKHFKKDFEFKCSI